MGAPVVSSARGGVWGRSLRGPVKRCSERPCAARAAQFVRERENQSCKRFGGALPAVGEPGRPVRARKSQSFSRCRVPGAARRPGPGEGWWPVGERTPTHPRQIAVRFPETNVSLKARTQNGPPEILPDPTRDPRGDPGREARSHGIRAATLPLFAALAAPGPGKPAPTLEREANSTGMKAKRHGSVR